MVLLLLFETQHSFCIDRNSNASKNLYITSIHIIQVTLQHIPAKIGFAETIGFMQGRKPLIVSKGRTTDYGTGLVASLYIHTTTTGMASPDATTIGVWPPGGAHYPSSSSAMRKDFLEMRLIGNR